MHALLHPCVLRDVVALPCLYIPRVRQGRITHAEGMADHVPALTPGPVAGPCFQSSTPCPSCKGRGLGPATAGEAGPAQPGKAARRCQLGRVPYPDTMPLPTRSASAAAGPWMMAARLTAPTCHLALLIPDLRTARSPQHA